MRNMQFLFIVAVFKKNKLFNQICEGFLLLVLQFIRIRSILHFFSLLYLYYFNCSILRTEPAACHRPLWCWAMLVRCLAPRWKCTTTPTTSYWAPTGKERGWAPTGKGRGWAPTGKGRGWAPTSHRYGERVASTGKGRGWAPLWKSTLQCKFDNILYTSYENWTSKLPCVILKPNTYVLIIFWLLEANTFCILNCHRSFCIMSA